ncbi:hypothetical protein GLI01_11050 [Gluconacetobacter liquefaciens]|uniref:DUF4169 family protein n=1 Tax=Gluconacetobacter liquefaciens TaxID=89584 RepID=A0A370G805_GLULI|nr:DUF4169 family protein [Gluconacetobacter liquefaciens]MBB2186119.1 DUF4169 family protein [Gluconacetobacter liquefaciens]RDI38654.1 uncharacterized protein DUF4169 [Gluconacetobacter liquefaciens]GEB37070.1 hypothetical protein GLI01_11050 [Gluconacetobacter liquefaciens]
MTEIVNLRQARKRKVRAEQAAIAARNRALHGRTLAERDRERQEAERARRMLDGAQLSAGPEGDGQG